jgi:phage-related protein
MRPREVPSAEKPLHWVARSRKELMALPSRVQGHVALALRLAQQGGRHESAKALKGFGDARVLEVVVDDKGGTYRAVYTVRFDVAVFVLHAFQKKSKRGIQTPGEVMRLIGQRLKTAAQAARELQNAQAEDQDR